MDLETYRKIKYSGALPYRKVFGSLNDYKIDLVKKIEEKEILTGQKKIRTEDRELLLYETRNGKEQVTSVFSTKKQNMWGKTSYPLLQDLIEPLNNKAEYDWEKIEGILLDFLKKTGKLKNPTKYLQSYPNRTQLYYLMVPLNLGAMGN